MSPCCTSTSEDLPNSNNEKSRGCTDVLCLAIFGIFWGLLIFIAAFAFVIGKPTRLAYGQDSFGNTCGMKNEGLGNMTFSGMDMTDRPYLFYLNMTDMYQSLKICVKKCPSKTLQDETEIREFEKSTGSHLCRYDVAEFKGRSALVPVLSNKTIERYFLHTEERNGHYACPVPPVYATKSLFKRCIPIAAANLASDIIYSVYAYLNSFDTIQQVVSDVYAVKIEIIEMIALSVVLSIVMIVLIHRLASFVAWIIMIVASIACVVGTCILWWTYIRLKWDLDETEPNQMLWESVQNEHTFLVYSILATIFTVVLLLLVLVMRKRVNVVVMLLVEAAECIKDIPCILIQPLITMIALGLFIFFWIAVLVALATAYYPIKNRIENPLQLTTTSPIPESGTTAFFAPVPEEVKLLNKGFTLVAFKEGSFVQYMWWYHIIALVWTTEFITGCQQMVIAGAVAKWYFTRDRSTVNSPILKSMSNLFVYHLGSVAVGSFLITLFKIPRLILTYIISYLRKREQWKCAACCLKCCTCCLWCMEKCIRYLNHNAYTIVAIQGTSFCPAAREAFDILLSNALQVAAINSVGDFILFLGKCSVAAITAAFSVLLLKSQPDLHFYAIPLIVISFVAYFVAHCVLSVYEMVIDTLFLCCCEDILRNDGSKEKPYYGGKLVRYIKGDKEMSMQPLNKIAAGDASETE